MVEKAAATHKLGIAGIIVVVSPDTIRTVLGSCIGIALYDRTAGIGGMAHIILPSSNSGKGAKGKFADTAVDELLDQLLREGSERRRITAKIAGGASMFGVGTDGSLGERNVQAVKERLAHHAVSLVAEHVGGTKGRRMTLAPSTGQVEVQIIGQDPTVL